MKAFKIEKTKREPVQYTRPRKKMLKIRITQSYENASYEAILPEHTRDSSRVAHVFQHQILKQHAIRDQNFKCIRRYSDKFQY